MHTHTHIHTHASTHTHKHTHTHTTCLHTHTRTPVRVDTPTYTTHAPATTDKTARRLCIPAWRPWPHESSNCRSFGPLCRPLAAKPPPLASLTWRRRIRASPMTMTTAGKAKCSDCYHGKYRDTKTPTYHHTTASTQRYPPTLVPRLRPTPHAGERTEQRGKAFAIVCTCAFAFSFGMLPRWAHPLAIATARTRPERERQRQAKPMGLRAWSTRDRHRCWECIQG